jgi:HAE1 family hydrophobic/amphiphilic exporter-1
MTSFAFVLGCVPLWLASGSGGVSRQTMGTVVIGGMLTATLLGIFIIPVAFYVVERISVRFSKGGPTNGEAARRAGEGPVQ